MRSVPLQNHPPRPRIRNSDDGLDNPDIGTGSEAVCRCDRHPIPAISRLIEGIVFL